MTKPELTQTIQAPKYTLKEYGKEQLIHLKNEKCHSMDIILHGRVAVQNIDENGNILTVNIFTDGDIIGVNLIFSRRNAYPMTVVAVSQTTILHLKSELILELCRSSEHFMLGLLIAISDKSVILTDRISALAHKTIRQNIIDFLKYEYHLQKSMVIQLNLSKKNLAERLGIQRSSLSRELNKMRSDGLLIFDAKTISLTGIDFEKF